MAIPYPTAKFKSANISAMAIWDPTAKFNSRQYFWLYSNNHALYYETLVVAIQNAIYSEDEYIKV